jgi:hypothetical protein
MDEPQRVDVLKLRLLEFQKSEETLVESLKQISTVLSSIQEDKRWLLDAGQIQMLDYVKSVVEKDDEDQESLQTLHSKFSNSLRRVAFAADQNVVRAMKGLKDIVECFLHPKRDIGRQMVHLHAEFELFSNLIIYNLQKKAGGQVKGDRAIGTSVKLAGSLAESLAAVQNLLVLPSQRIARYRLFLDEMARDAISTSRIRAEQDVADGAGIAETLQVKWPMRALTDASAHRCAPMRERSLMPSNATARRCRLAPALAGAEVGARSAFGPC